MSRTDDVQLTVGEFVQRLAERFPLEWAEDWDRSGLLAGDSSAPLRSVLVTLDADRAAVQRAVIGGHDLLLTHHPALLSGGLPITPDGPYGVAFDAVRAGVSLVAMHTNLDRSPAGASALATALGLEGCVPLETAAQPVAVVATFVPPEAAEKVAVAARAAGAGRVGMYEACVFWSSGSGHFASPVKGRRASADVAPTEVSEVRLETTCAPDAASSVMEAIRTAHPYEEPVVTRQDGGVSRGQARLGRFCTLSTPVTLAAVAAKCSKVLGTGNRTWGDPDKQITRVAVANGSGGSLIAAARAVQADVLVTGEVRYHDARAALEVGLTIVDVGHDASEWPIVRVLAHAAREALAGTEVHIAEERPALPWWTTERH